tara:strand:- start:7569 stop:11270 length:3702 start_codon:yes stop_codon:yes gene_type:complete
MIEAKEGYTNQIKHLGSYNMSNLFTTSPLNNNRTDMPVVRKVTGDTLESSLAGSSVESWENEPIGTGLKNTQQLLVDWDDFAKHVFFNSAEAKVNLAFDQIVNGYPFDGTSQEKREYLATISGYTKHILGKIDSHKGYMNFTGGNNTYLEVVDHTGFLAPDLATVVGDAKASRFMNTNGSTHEFWVYIPENKRLSSNQYAVIYQKAENPDAAAGSCSAGDASHANDENACVSAGHTWTTLKETKKGITIWHEESTLNSESNKYEYDVHFMIGSGDYKSITHSIPNLEHDRWYHVAFIYERAQSERVLSYVNGKYLSTTASVQAELDDITSYNGKIRIGWSDTRQVGYASTSLSLSSGNSPVYFQGLIDELRVWLGPRNSADISKYFLRNVNSQTNLLVSYRFNEPSTSTYNYAASLVILDYSGNSLHSKINNYADGSVRTSYTDSSGVVVMPPVSFEKDEDNKVLFPDWPPTKTLNETLLLEGNHYDRNNPNIITSLVPRHYFEEATFFEGVDKDWEEPKSYETSNTPTYPIPGHGDMPTGLVLMSFLLVWANFFDEIKLYIDHFSNLDKVSYDNYDQIPPQLITFMSDYYGINLPDPYTNETLDKYQQGEGIENTSGVHVPLKKTIDAMWRRVLINLPFLLRSRGTIQGIRALFNTLGIESDGIFKFREYGGNISTRINSSRRKRKKRIKSLNFKHISYAKSNSLWAYRHEPGAPDAAAAPIMSSIDAQFGDIVYNTPAGPPVKTQYTSGSWSYEGRYTLDSTQDTCSLFRIERNSEILVNLVAHRETDANTNAMLRYGLQLHVDGHKNTSDPVFLEIEKLDLWDSSPWYISVYHELGDNPRIGVRVLKSNDKYIIENKDVSKNIAKDSSGPLYLQDNTHSDTLRYYIGPSGASYGSRNPTGSAGTDTEHSRTTAYSGMASHIRFWTKSLTENESIEHVRNPFSVATNDPVSSFSFLIAPNQQLNSGTGLYENVPLEKYTSTYNHALPQGSWERLRNSFDMLQGDTTISGAGSIEVIDTSQNENNLTVYGSANETRAFFTQEMVYNISPTDFDFNSASNKIRVRSYLDKKLAKDNFAQYGKITKIPSQVGVDDRRFSIESSLVHALNEDMMNITGDSDIFNNYLGKPELEYAVSYPELTKIRDLYFERIVGRVNYNSVIEFQRWFNGNFSSLVEQFIPHTAEFLGINFVIESHMLERHKFEYKQGDVHVDVSDRVAFEQIPLFIGTIRSEIT